MKYELNSKFVNICEYLEAICLANGEGKYLMKATMHCDHLSRGVPCLALGLWVYGDDDDICNLDVQIQVRPVPRPRRGPTAPGACAGGSEAPSAATAPPAAPYTAVAGARRRVLRGRRVLVAARRSPHEATGGRDGHHPH